MSNRRTIKKSLALAMTMMLTLVLLLAIVAPALATENKGASGKHGSIAPSSKPGPTDPAEMETFLDDLLGKEMAEQHIAGAAVVVVKDGKLFFTKGYGYADLENKIPVDPERTMFKIGSGTKLFTWTAVMQLVEQGKLDLDADVNTYLDFHIPATFPQPITLKHLMTHTAGFEDQHIAMVTWNETELTPAGEWLASHIPARVCPPGERAGYSNYGGALAGYIVARVAGESYSQYVQEHILNPLGMRHTTAQSPTPAALRAYEAVGYLYQKDAFQVFPAMFGQIDLFPAGVIRASANDMARFMIAHLQNGFYRDPAAETRILQEATARQMHSTLYVADPRLLGSAYGFFEFSDNGQRVIGHSGEGEPMQSMLLLLPDQNVGAFVVYNSDAGMLTRQHFGFQRAFFDHYYPAPAPKPLQPPADFAARADHFVGDFRWTMSSYTTIEKYTSQLFGAIVSVSNPGDGTLLVTTPYGEWHAIEVEPMYFRQTDGPIHFLFRQDKQGNIAYLFTDMVPQFAFEKARWYETPRFNLPLLLFGLVMFVSILPVALVGAIRNRRAKGDHSTMPRDARLAIALLLGISILSLLFVVGTFVWGPWVAFGIPLAYKITMGLGVLVALLTVGDLVYAVLVWKERYWGVAFRSYYTLVTVAAVAFVWFLNNWNLLGWRY